MQHEYFKHLVKRYLEKKSTDEELEIFVHLMQQGKLDQYIQEAMDEDIEAEQHKELKDKGKNTRLGWSIAAAIVFMVMLLGYTKFQQRGTATPFVKINNTKNTILKEVLPDGTTVWLNPNTTLSYPKKFGSLRKVTMRGEAFFEVTKDHAHPFIINSAGVITKVWGTSFRIRSVAGENNTKVSVLSGKVSVTVPSDQMKSHLSAKTTADARERKEDKEILLLPQQEAIYQAADHRLVKAPIPESSDVIIWRKSELSFENTPLKIIASDLSRFYHVKLGIEGKELQDITLTADFTKKNLADILVLICKSLHTTYSKDNNTITIRTTVN